MKRLSRQKFCFMQSFLIVIFVSEASRYLFKKAVILKAVGFLFDEIIFFKRTRIISMSSSFINSCCSTEEIPFLLLRRSKFWRKTLAMLIITSDKSHRSAFHPTNEVQNDCFWYSKDSFGYAQKTQLLTYVLLKSITTKYIFLF